MKSYSQDTNYNFVYGMFWEKIHITRLSFILKDFISKLLGNKKPVL